MTFPWVKWLEYATELWVCLTNWDEGAHVPGINCNAKSLRLGPLRNMVEPFLDNEDGDGLEDAVSIQPWARGALH